jgi:hypothetical protein
MFQFGGRLRGVAGSNRSRNFEPETNWNRNLEPEPATGTPNTRMGTAA